MRSAAILALALGLPACHATRDFTACRQLLDDQAEAWNAGDLDGFVAGYYRSEHTVFSGASGTQLGFDALVARYKTAYPDKATMGRLTFDGLEFSRLGSDHVLAKGRWRLERELDEPHGQFALVFRRFDDGWKIVLDYTTSAGPD